MKLQSRDSKNTIFFIIFAPSKVKMNEKGLMTLHIFNPEHDIALAANLSNFTAPRAGRQLRHDLGFLPALWAEEGDVILVDDMDDAARQWQKLCGTDEWPCWKENVSTLEINGVDAWGWDLALCAHLKRRGVPVELLPDNEHLERIRQLSHRRTAAHLLAQLQEAGIIGEASECSSLDEVKQFLSRHQRMVLKAPWSSSGRGVRYFDVSCLKEDVSGEAPGFNWVSNILKTQGSIMAEPHYRKVMDFGMEFKADGNGALTYEGLSLFHTVNGAYTGNLIASEEDKLKIISAYIPASLINSIQEKIIRLLDLQDYRGCWGVDMMIVVTDEGEYLLHPCVEINLRRTMGHVALALGNRLSSPQHHVMQISYDGSHYRLSCQKATAAAAATLSESTP